MQLYTCTVKIGASQNHVVAKKVVSVPEIAVLKYVHGDEAVSDITVFKLPELKSEPEKAHLYHTWSPATERERLALAYPAASEDKKPPVIELYGPVGALPMTLAEIGISPASAAAEKRRRAEQLAREAAELESQVEASIDDILGEEPSAAPKRSKAA